MSIILRKQRGAKNLEPLFASSGGGSFGAGVPSGRVYAVLTSPWMLALVGLALLVAWLLFGPPAESTTFGFAGVIASDAIKDLHEKRRKAIADARVINDKAGAEKRDLTAEENTQYEALMAEARSLQTRVDRELALREEERKLAERVETERPPEPDRRTAPPNENAEQRTARIMREVRTMDEAAYSGLEEIREFGEALRYEALTAKERRALEVTNSASGGYLQPPQEFIAKIIQAVDNLVFMRRLGVTYQVPQAESLGAPSLDNDPADPTWVSELNIGSEDSTMSVGKRELRPHPLAQFIKVSRTLLRKAAVGPEALVRQRLAYKSAVVQENAFLNGTGAAQPLGVFTASALGISTSRDVSTGNTTTSMTFDGLKAAKWSVKSQYWPRLQWIFHPDGGEQIDKLKDGNGQYIWQPSVVAGQPDRLLSFPVNISEYAPNTFTTGLYVGILGDFSNYWIADALSMEIQTLNELYAGANQVGFLIRSETDGMPVLEEAFARVKLA